MQKIDKKVIENKVISDSQIKKAKDLIIKLIKEKNYCYWSCLIKNNTDNIDPEYFKLALARLKKENVIRSKEDSYEHCLEYSFKK